MYTYREKRTSGMNWIKYAAVALAAAVLTYGAASLGKWWVHGSKPELALKAAVLVDADTGKVLYELNADEALPPASMSKMMTELIVLDRIEDGSVKWNDVVAISDYAAAVPGSRMGLEKDDRFTVRELFEAMTVHSANDAAVALAEHVAGTEEAFVRLMNERASRIGMSEAARFGNATGLSRSDIRHLAGAAAERDTLMTAKDTARLAGYLIGKYPEVLSVTSRSSVNLAERGRSLPATNLMLKDGPFAYPGSDGLKTGYTPEAGYCFTGTAKRGDQRLISVVMGAPAPETRFVETRKLYELGFRKKGWPVWGDSNGSMTASG